MQTKPLRALIVQLHANRYTVAMEKDNLKKGICYLVFSAFCFALMGMLAHMAGDIPFIEKTLFRNLIAFFIALVALLQAEKKNRQLYNISVSSGSLSQSQPYVSLVHIPQGSFKYLFSRAAAGSLGIFGNFYALDRLNIADASILNKMSPFFALLFSFFIVGEKVDTIPFAAVCGAFGGAMLIIKPTFALADMGHFIPAICGFVGGMGAGLAYACVRKLHQYNVNGSLIIVFFSAFSTLVAVPFLLIHFTPMTTIQLLILIGCGVAAAGGQFGITYAYFNAPASKISIFDYSQIIFSSLMGYFAFGQVPDTFSLVGYIIIIAMSFVVFLYNKKNS